MSSRTPPPGPGPPAAIGPGGPEPVPGGPNSPARTRRRRPARPPDRRPRPAGRRSSGAGARPAGLRPRAEAGVRTLLPPGLRDRSAVDPHDVAGEVVAPAQQRGSDAVGVDGDVLGLEARILDGEAARDDDPDPLVARRVERRADLAHERGVTPWCSPGSSSPPRKARSTSASEVSSRTPHRSSPERVGDLDRGARRVVVEVGEHGDVHVVARSAGRRPPRRPPCRRRRRRSARAAPCRPRDRPTTRPGRRCPRRSRRRRGRPSRRRSARASGHGGPGRRGSACPARPGPRRRRCA